MLISVIVPFYKSEKYISKCLNSILNQTYKNIEVLLINDGSPDSSRNICQSIIANDSRAKIIDKKNGGVSSARNLGLKFAKGDFITFVDSDDELKLDLYEKMVKYISDDVDMVCCGIERYDSNGKMLYKLNTSDGKVDFTPFEAMRACLENKEIGFNVYTKLFRNRLFFENDIIKFPEGRLMEEASILPYIFKKCHKIVHCGYAGYKYFIRENSYTTKTISEETYYIYQTIDEYEQKLEKIYPGIKRYILKWKYINCINLYRTALLDKKNVKKEVFNKIKKHFDLIWITALFSNLISIRQKMIILETKSRFVLLRKRRRKI